MKKTQVITLVVLVALVVFLITKVAIRPSTEKPLTEESRLETILKTGKIRASYLVYSPYFRKDPNTGELSGIFHDIMEEIGRAAELKIEWVEEVGYEGLFAGLDSRRYDVFAGGLWPSTSRAKAGGFTIPVFYSVIKAWGRKEESRFEGLKGINSPDVRIATIDGAMEDIIAKTDFPSAHRESLPQLSMFTQNLINITHKKADVTFAEPGIIQEFLQTNPGTLKELAPDKPLRIFGNSIVVPRGDFELKAFLDVALREMLYSGIVERILKRYEPAPGIFPRVALPYQPETAILRLKEND